MRNKYNTILSVFKNSAVLKCSNTQSYFIIDLDDLNLISSYVWKENKSGYIYANINHKIVLLHRFLSDLEDDSEFLVDHIDRNRKNNKKNNLRVVTSLINNRNKSMYKNNISGYTGIYYNYSTSKWVAKIGDTFIGSFLNIQDAINARTQKEIELFYYHN